MNFEKPFYHFSIDDVFDSLIEVSDKGMGLFNHSLFGFLKRVHDDFDTIIHLYLFYQKHIKGKTRTLSEITDAHREAFLSSPWLRFGPHALDWASPPYAQATQDQKRVFDKIYQEIERFAGPGLLSKWVRLHKFSESYELGDYFRQKGVEALFSTDRDAASYRMDDSTKNKLKKEGWVEFNGMNFIRSHGRIEYLEDDETREQLFEKLLVSPGFSVIFTHEIEVLKPIMQDRIRYMAEYFSKRNIPAV